MNETNDEGDSLKVIGVQEVKERKYNNSALNPETTLSGGGNSRTRRNRNERTMANQAVNEKYLSPDDA